MSDVLPTLTDDERMAMTSVFMHGLFNPKFAANFYVDPHPIFESYALNRQQISQIVHYFRWINDRCNQRPPHFLQEPTPPKDEISANELIEQQHTPSLSFKEKDVLMSMVRQLLHDPEFAIKLIIQPLPLLVEAGLDSDEIDEVIRYFRLVFNLIKRYHQEDWMN